MTTPQLTEQERDQLWREWIDSRPAPIRAVAERFKPWVKMRMASTGQVVSVQSFSEEDDGRVTVKVLVEPEDNPHLPMRHLLFGGAAFEVFGVNPDDLESLQ